MGGAKSRKCKVGERVFINTKKVQTEAFPKGWPPSQRMQFALRFDPNPLIHHLHHPAVRVLILK